jgi:serine/threonine-protein kinase
MEKNSFLDSIEKPESFQKEEFISVSNKKRRNQIITILVVLSIIISSFIVYGNSQKVEVIAFNDMSIEELTVWARNNEIVLITNKSFSEELEKGRIISQNILPSEIIKKGDSITVVVSDGPNPSLEIDIPNLIELNFEEIRALIDEYQLTGLKFKYEYSESVALNDVISIVYQDDEYPFLRKSRVEVTFSKGSETDSQSFIVPDFNTMTKEQALEWSKKNKVSIEFVEEYSETINSGSLISQSIDGKKEVPRSTLLTLTYSKGKRIEVPYFERYSKEDALKWAEENHVTLKIVEHYHDQTPIGVPVHQSIKKGSIIDEGEELTLIYSLGKVDINSFVGSSLLEFENWIIEVNQKGANLKFNVEYLYSPTTAKRHIITQSHEYKKISVEETIELVVSRGSGIILPKFIGLSESDAITLCNESDITCAFDYQSSESPVKTVISQSASEGSLITDKTILKLIISLGN